MYAYIKGAITYRSAAFVVLETGGIGYHLNIPLSTYTALEGKEQATLYTHLAVREDAHVLYGFSTQYERGMFLHLLDVTGVGATTALLLLSSMSVDELRAAIIGEQLQVLQRAKGIGAKTAKQIVLDLKPRLLKEAPDAPVLLAAAAADNTLRDEALSALIALGFNRVNVQKALNTVIKDNPGISKVEEMIKLALRYLAS